MKQLRFKELTVLSLVEKTARKINLDYDISIIASKDNDTGKSCIIKSLYYALGAWPMQVHPEWEKIKPITFLKFAKDDTIYYMLRFESIAVLFNSSFVVLKSFPSIGNDLSRFYDEFFNFKLKLVHNQSGEMRTPFASHYFLPFYIDQDSGWKKNWNSFDRLNAFEQWKRDLIDYHTGIKPNEYYELKAKKALKIDEKQEKAAELSVIEKMYQRNLNNDLRTEVNPDVYAFKNDINELIEKLNEIKNKENRYKAKVMDLYNKRALLDHQISLADKTRKELVKDFEFAEQLDEEIPCPTCGTIHKNSFTERYIIAQDENRCYELMLDLKLQKDYVEKDIKQEQEELNGYANQRQKLEDILNRTRGQLKFRDYIENVGQKKFIGNIKIEIASLEFALNKLEEEIKSLEKQMRQYTDGEVEKTIEGQYLALMRKYLYALNVHRLREEDYKGIHSNIKENGSDLPRALLAYFYTILHVMKTNSSIYYCPIVIDSPLQDEQSYDNRIAILEFIKKELPDDSQLILGCVGMDELSYDGKVLRLNGVKFENVNFIELTEQFHVLQQESYDAIFSEVKPILDKAMGLVDLDKH